MKKNKSPLVSIIITTKNEEQVILNCIKSIKNQSYKNIEIILVDNFSTDKTTDIAKKQKVQIYFKGPERSVQRNFGAKRSKGSYLVFIDADMELSKNVIKECVEKITSNNNLELLVIPEQSTFKNIWERIKAYERSIYNLDGDDITDAARFFSKKIFVRFKGYDVRITGPEDWDLPDRIKSSGYKVGRIKAKIFHHERIPSIRNLLRKKYYYALKTNLYLKQNNISALSPKTVYFLRPVFYKNWKYLISNPILTCGLIFMLTLELFAGALGFFIGKFFNE